MLRDLPAWVENTLEAIENDDQEARSTTIEFIQENVDLESGIESLVIQIWLQ